ncbi:MAG: hypothetical protein IH926_11575 [Proteobacteria bacterium]|nr:hypothetical protein [Pseudomonadota bacterium]
MTGSPRDIAALDRDGLKRWGLQLWEEVARLKLETAALREAIARLKGLEMGFERRVATRTGFATRDRLLMRRHANKDPRLLAL